MATKACSNPTRSPRIVATGFTTAYLGDERSLREFIVGDHVRKSIISKGDNAILYLINDSYDPLTLRQLRLGVNKDEKLLKNFAKYCGRPISEIPDPFNCHESYSEHFAQALLDRLRLLGIHPVYIDTYRAYRNGYYADYVSATFKNYSKVQNLLAQTFDSYTIQNLFHAQCPICQCIDATHIRNVSDVEVRIKCERCTTDLKQHIDEINGKLSWKFDCAARWNIYGIDIEVFSKSHLAGLGSYEISSFLSQKLYGGIVPAPVKYGIVKISQEMSYRLLEMLPPKILKKLFTTHMTRDIEISKDSVEYFCHKVFVRRGVSYVDYVRRELAKHAISERVLNRCTSNHVLNNSVLSINDKALVEYGNRFSRFYYEKDFGVRLPDTEAVASADITTARIARDVIAYALSVREPDSEDDNSSVLIRSYLRERREAGATVHEYLRRVFGQPRGPKISSMLALLPMEYLRLVQMILGYYTGEQLGSKAAGKIKDFNQVHLSVVTQDDEATENCCIQ